MKISSLFIEKEENLEDTILSKMKNFDWKYEFSDNIIKIASGNKELALIENLVYKLYIADPDKAIKIWNTNSPAAPADKTIVPSFIFRMQESHK